MTSPSSQLPRDAKSVKSATSAKGAKGAKGATSTKSANSGDAKCRDARQSHPRCASVLMGLLAVILAITSCVTELDPDAGDDYVEPFDDGENFDLQGIYDCSERRDTGYRSGSSFSIKVVRVDGRDVEADTANAYIVMQEAARKDGVTIRIVSGFRSQSEQQYLYGCYVNCSCNGCNLAARPGYSNHQSGHALDLNTADGSVLNWLTNHGSRYGFSRTVPGEPWHWEWWGGGPGGGPCGSNLPRGCQTGDFDGIFCDDDKSSNESEHNELWNQLGVHFKCKDKGGRRAFCPGADASRAQAVMVLGKGFDAPGGKPNAFVDDGGHTHERWLNSAAFYGILKGDDRKVHPDRTLTRSGLAIILKRTFALPEAKRDYFDDDERSDAEDAHNRVAAAGLMLGFNDGHGRRDFKGGKKINRSALAVVATRAKKAHLKPIWDLPRPCQTGNFQGIYCDDDNSSHQADHNQLNRRLDIPFTCGELNGHPAFCPAEKATRGQAVWVLTRAAGIPLNGHPNAFRDDNHHGWEKTFDAAHDFGIIRGYDNDRDMRPGIGADRTMLAIILARIYDLPRADRDYFTDDNGSPAEVWHNKVAAAGLFAGFDNGRGGRKFMGNRRVTRSTLATLAVRADALNLIPIWDQD